MEFLRVGPLAFRNATVVTADRAFNGYAIVDDGLISEVDEGEGPQNSLDFEGDYLIAGLIELHTDHLEQHYAPRPSVLWHAGSAVLAYDAQIAAAGITTVFDSFRVGIDEFETKVGMGDKTTVLAEAVRRAEDAGLLRAAHLTHLRCEVPAPNCVAYLEQFLRDRPAGLISLMDHTPGQRQFRSLEKYFSFYSDRSGRSIDELGDVVRSRQQVGGERARAHRPKVIEIAKARGITLASHDDTTIEDVEQSKLEGVAIAEFPTTLEAAVASRQAGMWIVMGAPNVVRGGSHSGNVSARALAEEGELDILSSDYVPAALLMAAFRLTEVEKVGGLPGAIRVVTKNPAQAVGLADRGEIAPGKRADLLRVAMHDGEPVVRAVWREGRRVA